jgi:ubiquinone/menaquinone biosynthesis C-methylase UbiE
MSTDIIRANIEVHSRMADTYNEQEPHFRPENQKKVRGILEELHPARGGKLLDIGCGTGFIIHLARDLFDEIHGVDVTPAMLARIDTSSGNITLHNAQAEELPFADDTFDMVSSYAFIHHLENYQPVLAEALRVVRPGGLVYIDLEPNKLFWEHISQLEGSKHVELSDIVLKEIDSVLHTDDRVEEEFGIPKDVFQKAEFTKSILGGISPWQFQEECRTIGFSDCEVHFEWFLGQGAVMHGQSFEAASIVETYLRRVLPLSGHLFKYLRFILKK